MSIQDDIPRSRINLRYRTEIEGELQEVELPFRLIVLGDLSAGSSVDRQGDLESRRLRSLGGKNLDSLMADMKMSLSFEVKNCIDPQTTESLEVKLPVHSRASFNPAEVASNIPKVRGLLLLRKLLLETQSNIDNRRELRRIIYELFQNPAELKKLREELQSLQSYHVSDAKALPATAAAG